MLENCSSQTKDTLHKWYLKRKTLHTCGLNKSYSVVTITFLMLAQAAILSISFTYKQFSINKTMVDISFNILTRRRGFQGKFYI